jgi:dTMP kinase
MRGRFIAFEGGEACGKSTQARLLAPDIGALLTFETGATAVGRAVRALTLDPATRDLATRAEALLIAADRAQHVAEVVRPALDRGTNVITDRYLYSSVAYQGYGRGLPPGEVEWVSVWATEGLLPDLVVLLDIDPAVAEARRRREPDRIEGAGDGFHERVRDGYLTLAAADPARWIVLDGAAPSAEIAVAVRAAVRDRLEL